MLRDNSPSYFAGLETRNSDFQAFCFDTHADAYTDAGLCALSIADLVAIASTPDIGDLLTLDGLSQMTNVSVECLGDYIAQANTDLVDIVADDPQFFSPANKL